MAVRQFLTLINGVTQRVQAIIASAGVADANKIIATDGTGRLDVSLMPVGLGADTLTVQASENLAAGDFVNIHDVTGSARVRKASAADATKPAHGFVLNGVTSGASATVYFEGSNTAVTGRVIGTEYALSTTVPGSTQVATTALTAGQVFQAVGVATSATSIASEIDTPITIVA